MPSVRTVRQQDGEPGEDADGDWPPAFTVVELALTGSDVEHLARLLADALDIIPDRYQPKHYRALLDVLYEAVPEYVPAYAARLAI